MIKNFFNNRSLKKKIMLLIYSILVFTTFASFIVIHIISSSNERLLYKALAGSLTYSASEISRKLSNIESVSGSIIANKDIKKNLIRLSDSDPIKRMNAENTLEYLIYDYYQSNLNNNVRFINLYSPNHTLYSYRPLSNTVPADTLEKIVRHTKQKEGYPYWNTDYCNQYGLFLGRDCRRVNQLNYETLGTFVIQIDIDKMIEASTESILLSPSIQYVLLQDNKFIYQSQSLSDTASDYLNQNLLTDYAVMKLDGNNYFCVRGIFPNINWEYICLIPYQDIAHALGYAKFLSALVILIMITIALLLSNVLSQSISIHFQKLLIKMDAFGKDEKMLLSSNSDYTDRQDEVGLLHNKFDRMVIKIQELIDKNYINEILTKEAQIKALENQINPHFLYNTLESINWRAKAINEKDISAMVEALGHLLRISLEHQQSTGSLAQELQIIHQYITIQKIRFEERLLYAENIAPNLSLLELPPLTIQPLIENAIRYGLEENTEPCTIELAIDLVDDLVQIKVINSGSQFEDNLLNKLINREITPNGLGYGLLNIHNRLQLIFGKKYGLRLFNLDDNHAVAQITIPQTTITPQAEEKEM